MEPWERAGMPVVEGETDYLLLEAIILELFPTARLFPIQPTEPGKGGWRDVQKWCQETWPIALSRGNTPSPGTQNPRS